MISAKQAQSKTKEAIQRIKEEEKAEYSEMLSRIKVEKDLEGLGYSVVRDEFSFPYITITINWGKNND